MAIINEPRIGFFPVRLDLSKKTSVSFVVNRRQNPSFFLIDWYHLEGVLPNYNWFHVKSAYQFRQGLSSMLKRTPTIIFFFVLSITAFAAYQYFNIPEGVTPQSDQSGITAWVSFWASIVALIAAIIGLVEKIIGMRKNDD